MHRATCVIPSCFLFVLIGVSTFFVALTAAADGTDGAPKAELAKADDAQSASDARSTAPAADTSAGQSSEQTPASGTENTTQSSDAAAAESDAVASEIISAMREHLARPELARQAHPDDLKALKYGYGTGAASMHWVTENGLTAAANSVIAEIKKADDWGLEASAFEPPDSLPASAATSELVAAETKVSLSVLKYVRYARGGRVNPRSLRLFDQKPELEDPRVVLDQIWQSDDAAEYLRSQHPKHAQFLSLRKELLKLRAPQEETAEDVAEKAARAIKIPDGPTLRPSMTHDTIALVRRRLQVPVENGEDENLYDDKLAKVIKAFQAEQGLRAEGIIGPQTRAALNGAGQGKGRSRERRIQQIVINMERWRWMPRSMGDFHIWNNIPEYRTRAFKSGKQIYSEKIIVGKTGNATPVFSADMKFVIFHPSWGVPNGIKRTEILPYLRQSTGFFGFGGSDTRILKAHKLTVMRNGRRVDASKINWAQVDIRNYDFVQGPGAHNVLGKVKFRFPNRHDVYMHDTPERHLFKETRRTLSHGCIRVRHPRRLAEIILAEDKGWSAEKVGRMWRGVEAGNVTLNSTVPVHTGYFTAIIDQNGKLRQFADVYAHDRRLAAAIGRGGKGYIAGPRVAERGKNKPSRTVRRKKKKQKKNYESVADVISNYLSN